MTGLVTAVRLLTRIGPRDGTTHDPPGAVVWLPVVGAAVGAAGGGIYVAMHALDATPVLSAALAVLTTVIVTGALHEDGLADTADALGTRDAAAARRAMKDPRVGTFGVIALSFSLLIRVAALASLAPLGGLRVMVAGHAAARLAIVVSMVRHRAVLGDGLGATFTRHLRGVDVVAAVVLGSITVVIALGVSALGVLPVPGIVAITVRRATVARVGEVTGDTFGAIEQVTEMAVVVCLALASQHAWV